MGITLGLGINVEEENEVIAKSENSSVEASALDEAVESVGSAEEELHIEYEVPVDEHHRPQKNCEVIMPHERMLA